MNSEPSLPATQQQTQKAEQNEQRKGEGGDLPDRAEGFPCGRSELEAPFAAIWISALGAGD